MKNHAHTKQTQCVLKARGLHKHMSRQDSAHSSDISGEDHIRYLTTCAVSVVVYIQFRIVTQGIKNQNVKLSFVSAV